VHRALPSRARRTRCHLVAARDGHFRRLRAQLRAGGIQMLMATHSPVMAAVPDAGILELDEDGFEQRDRDELHVRMFRQTRIG
jgi:predicted ATPase